MVILGKDNLWLVLPGLLSQDLWRGVQAAAQVAEEFSVPAWLVGGVVRDALLGLSPRDVDIVVEERPEAFSRCLAQKLRGKIVNYPEFLTCKVIFRGGELNIAALRQEEYANPGTLPVTALGTWEQDVRRRDFSINALYMSLAPDLLGTVIDPCGGLPDLAGGLLRTLYEESFIDDATRILRGVRLAGTYTLQWEENTWQEAISAIDKGIFNTLSGSRIWQELSRMLAHENFVSMASLLAKLGFCYQAPQSLAHVETAMSLVPDSDRVLLNLLLFTGDLSEDAASELAEIWQLPGSYKKVLAIPRPSLPLDILSLGEWHDCFHGRNQEEILAEALAGGEVYLAPAIAYLARRSLKPALNGQDLIAMGLPPGPLYKEILYLLSREKISGKLTGKRSQRAFVRSLFASNNKEETDV